MELANDTVQSQVNKIQNILNKDRKIPDYRFNFGQYEGRLLSYVYKRDKKYLKWLYQEGVKLPTKVESFISQL